MVLRFEVDQAEAFRRGINIPKSIVHLDVDPSKLPQDERDLIADRLQGIDVCRLTINEEDLKDPGGNVIEPAGSVCHEMWKPGEPIRILAKGDSYEDLLAAVLRNQNEVNKKLEALKARKAEGKSLFKAMRKCAD